MAKFNIGMLSRSQKLRFLHQARNTNPPPFSAYATVQGKE